MAIFKNQVAIKNIRAWVGSQIDLIPSTTFTETPAGSGLFSVAGLTESPAGSGLYLIPAEFDVGENNEHQIVKAYYWDELGVEYVVFDGTQSQFVVALTLIANAIAPKPSVSVSPDPITVVTSTATVTMSPPPVVSASTSLIAVSAVGAAQGQLPVVTASYEVTAPTATSQAQLVNILHSPNISAPAATATSRMENPVYQIQGSAFVTAATGLSTAKGEVPVVTASFTTTPPTTTAQAKGEAPTYNRSRTITAVTSTGSSTAPAPTVKTNGDPMRMNKSSDQAIASTLATTAVKVTGWSADAGYPFTVISTDGLVMNGAITATIKYRGEFTSAIGTRGFQLRINGVTVDTAGDEIERSYAVTLASNDRIEMYAFNNYQTGRTVKAFKTDGITPATYIYIQ